MAGDAVSTMRKWNVSGGLSNTRTCEEGTKQKELVRKINFKREELETLQKKVVFFEVLRLCEDQATLVENWKHRILLEHFKIVADRVVGLNVFSPIGLVFGKYTIHSA